MNKNLKLVVNNPHNQIEERQFFEKNELKIILDSICKNGFCRIMERLWFKHLQSDKLVLVFLKMQQRTLYIKFVKTLSQAIKI